MTRMMRGLLAVMMMCALLIPSLAEAGTSVPTNATAGSTLGPAVYHSTNLHRASTLKGGGQYVATNTLDRHAWTGLWLYSLTVNGYYHSTGTTIDYYGGSNATATSAGYLMWQVGGTSASWLYSQPSGGTVGATGTFTHGVPTPWGSYNFQTFVDSVQAQARP